MYIPCSDIEMFALEFIEYIWIYEQPRHWIHLHTVITKCDKEVLFEYKSFPELVGIGLLFTIKVSRSVVRFDCWL